MATIITAWAVFVIIYGGMWWFLVEADGELVSVLRVVWLTVHFIGILCALGWSIKTLVQYYFP